MKSELISKKDYTLRWSMKTSKLDRLRNDYIINALEAVEDTRYQKGLMEIWTSK